MAGSRVDVVHREATPSAPLTRSGAGRMLRCPVSGGRSGEGVVSPTPARSDLLGSDCLGLRARGASGCRCSSLAQGVWAARDFPDSVIGLFQAAVGDSR